MKRKLLRKITAVFSACLLLFSSTSCAFLESLFSKETGKNSPTLDSLTVTAEAEFANTEVSLSLKGELTNADYESLDGYDVEFGLLAVYEDYALGDLLFDSNFTNMRSAKKLTAEKNGDDWSFSCSFENFEQEEATANIFVRAYAHVTDKETKKSVLTGYSEVKNTNFAYLAYVALQGEISPEAREKAETLVGSLTFYPITCDDGVTAEYDYAYEGQTVKVNVAKIRGKSLKELKIIASTGEVVYDMAKKSFVMPGANVALIPEYISGLKNPMILAGLAQTDAMGYWYGPTGQHWSGPADAIYSGVAETVTVSETDYASLKEAGYRGYMNKRYASGISVSDNNNWRTVAVWFEEGMDHPFWQSVGGSGIYVSIWLKSSVGFGASRRFMTYKHADDPLEREWSYWSPDQDNFNEQYKRFEKANGWQELVMSVECFKQLKNESGYKLGVVFWNMEDYSDDIEQYLTVWGAEVVYETLEQPTGPVDVSIDTQDLPYSDTHEWRIYQGEKLLEKGKDYRVNGNTVYGLNKGDYTIVYDFSVGAYEQGTVLNRSMKLK